MSASLALSGRAGSTKLAARIDAGFAEPGHVCASRVSRAEFRRQAVVRARRERRSGDARAHARRQRAARRAAGRDRRGAGRRRARSGRAARGGLGLRPGCGPARPGRSFPKGWAAVETRAATLFLRQQDGRMAPGGRPSRRLEHRVLDIRHRASIHRPPAHDSRAGYRSRRSHASRCRRSKSTRRSRTRSSESTFPRTATPTRRAGGADVRGERKAGPDSDDRERPPVSGTSTVSRARTRRSTSTCACSAPRPTAITSCARCFRPSSCTTR